MALIQCLLYHDLPYDQDSFVLSILKMNYEAKIITDEIFVTRVQEMKKGQEDDIQRHQQNLDNAVKKKQVTQGTANCKYCICPNVNASKSC